MSPTQLKLILWALLAIAAWLGWGLLTSHYETKGYNRCQVEALEAADKREKHEREQSRDIQKETDEAAKDDAREIETKVVEIKEVIREVYRDSPADGSCHRPLDDRVQAGLEAAVSRANARSL